MQHACISTLIAKVEQDLHSRHFSHFYDLIVKTPTKHLNKGNNQISILISGDKREIVRESNMQMKTYFQHFNDFNIWNQGKLSKIEHWS